MRIAMPGAVLLAASLLLTGCQAGATSPAESSPSAAAPHSASAQPATSEADIAKVRKLLPEQAPLRVVSMSVGLTEIADALGVPLVGVPSSQNPLPEGVKDVEKVGNSVEPNLEKIAQLKPDLVLSPASIGESIDKKLKPLNLESSHLPTDSVAELKATTLALGELFDATEQAQDLVRQVEQAEAAARDTAAGESKKVLMLFGSPGELMVMEENTFAGEIAKSLGAVNVATELGQGEAYTPLSMEQVVAQDPDVVLILAHGEADTVLEGVKEELAGQAAWQKVTASKNDAIHALPFELYGLSSITSAPEAFKTMAAALGS